MQTDGQHWESNRSGHVTPLAKATLIEKWLIQTKGIRIPMYSTPAILQLQKLIKNHQPPFSVAAEPCSFFEGAVRDRALYVEGDMAAGKNSIPFAVCQYFEEESARLWV